MNKTIFEVLPVLDTQLQAVVTELVETLNFPYDNCSRVIYTACKQSGILGEQAAGVSPGFVYYVYDQLTSGVSKEDIIQHIITLLYRYHGGVTQSPLPLLLTLE